MEIRICSRPENGELEKLNSIRHNARHKGLTTTCLTEIKISEHYGSFQTLGSAISIKFETKVTFSGVSLFTQNIKNPNL